MDRKKSHIELASSQARQPNSDFDRLHFDHCALPQIDFASIDIGTHFLGFDLSAPILISSMTGGTEEAKFINQNLAIAARQCQVALAVGSQRISLEHERNTGLDGLIRQTLGNSPLFGNVGLANLIKWNDSNVLRRCAERINADGMFIHLNPMQEVFQDKGDTDWNKSIDFLYSSIESCPVPVIVKEVGMGLSLATGELCQAAGAAAIDIAGKGGTDFISIEGAMTSNPGLAAATQVFSTWGRSTPMLLKDFSEHNFSLPIIASGGVRNGLDIAKALSLGATVTGIAGRILPAARQSENACIEVIEQLKLELQVACWGTGSANLKELKKQPLHTIRM